MTSCWCRDTWRFSVGRGSLGRVLLLQVSSHLFPLLLQESSHPQGGCASEECSDSWNCWRQLGCFYPWGWRSLLKVTAHSQSPSCQGSPQSQSAASPLPCSSPKSLLPAPCQSESSLPRKPPMPSRPPFLLPTPLANSLVPIPVFSRVSLLFHSVFLFLSLHWKLCTGSMISFPRH